MEISKNIFAYVSQIRNFNEKVVSLNEKFEQFFSLEFSYFKTKYLFEKNFKTNLNKISNYQKVNSLLQKEKFKLESIRKNKDFLQFEETSKKINDAIVFYNKEIAFNNQKTNQKSKAENILSKTMQFKEKFESDPKNKKMSQEILKVENNIEKYQQYLLENAIFENMNIDGNDEIKEKLKKIYLKKEQILADVKETNMSQELKRLTEIVERIESSQSKGISYAKVILDNRFTLKKIEHLLYFEKLKSNVFQLTENEEVDFATKYLDSVKQKISKLGFEHQKGKNDFP